MERKLLFHTPDAMAAASLGLRRTPGDLPPGRALHISSGRTIQIAVPHRDGLVAAVAEIGGAFGGGPGGPQEVAVLPSIVKIPDVANRLQLEDDRWLVPIGIGDTDLAPTGWELGEGDHVLIVGEARSGRSSLLAGLATMFTDHDPDIGIVAVAPRRSPLREVAGVATLVTDPAGVHEVVEAALAGSGRRLLLFDDIDDLEDAGGVLEALAASRDPDLHVIAAARRDIKGRYNHWGKQLTGSRKGLWLQPGSGLDGDLWSTPMPRRIPHGIGPGRGYVITDGTVELVQTAM